MSREYFAVIGTEDIFECKLIDGFFNNEALARKLYEERKSDPLYKDVWLVKVIDGKLGVNDDTD